MEVELIVQVQRTYGEFKLRKIDFAFLSTTLHCFIGDTLSTSIHGSNERLHYPAHVGWERRQCWLRTGTLPDSVLPSALQVFDMLEEVICEMLAGCC